MNTRQTGNTHAIESEKKALADSGYGNRAIEYFMEKPFMGDFPDADHVSEMVGTCGDTMKVFLKIDNNVVKDARYQVLGCPGAVSAAMAVVDTVRGKTLEEAEKINDGHIFNVLENVPAKKHHCIQLAVKTFLKAIDEYKNGVRFENAEPQGCDSLCAGSECCSKNLN